MSTFSILSKIFKLFTENKCCFNDQKKIAALFYKLLAGFTHIWGSNLRVCRFHVFTGSIRSPWKVVWPSNAWNRACPELNLEIKPFVWKAAGVAPLLYVILLAFFFLILHTLLQLLSTYVFGSLNCKTVMAGIT